ncbi:MAG TPA: PDC sensor domain-containing protein [Cellvibrio sp.]|nr:PDC sensor domain-containing protein [Cellvibrio sp.]
MTPRNYLYLLRKYDDYQPQLERLLGSIVTALMAPKLESDPQQLQKTVNRLHQSYPFVELLYCLDEQGLQTTVSAAAPGIDDSKRTEPGLGSDRSNRAYYTNAIKNEKVSTVTAPYLSNATHQLAISAVQRYTTAQNKVAYLVINFNLEKLIIFLNGDEIRRRVHPLFQVMYAVIGLMLIVVSGLLLYEALKAMFEVMHEHINATEQIFGIVILNTLGLAIFDLGKTILEEEVLLHKDIHHEGSTRRTISRFMSAIVIAVSIESLLLMFKSLLGDSGHLDSAVLMLFAAVALLIGLGIYLKLTDEKK